MSRGTKRLYQMLNILAVAATIVVNILSVTVPFFGNTQAEVSGRYPNLFVPAGFTFSIWGVIWLLLVLFAVWQARDLFRREEVPMPFLAQIGPWFAVATLGNLGWLFVFQADLIVLSMVPILLLFAGLLVIYQRLRVGRVAADGRAPASSERPAFAGDRLAVHLPFSVYLGWVSIAVIANATAALVSLGWRGSPLPEAFWAVLMIAVGGLLAVLQAINRGDLFFALAVAWALGGIAAQRAAAADAPVVLAAAAAVGVLVLLAAAWAVSTRGLYRSRSLPDRG